MAIRLDVQDVLTILQDELEGLNEAEDQRAYLVARVLQAYDGHIAPLDVPGPDVLIDPAIRAMLGPLVGIVYDQLLAAKAAKQAG